VQKIILVCRISSHMYKLSGPSRAAEVADGEISWYQFPTTNSLDQHASREAGSGSATQENARLLWNKNVH
jgi:hypothetical protein